MIKPYVYIIQNIERTHWYVGYKQKPKAGEDYWGSSKYLKELIAQTGKENWTKTIVAEFDTWQEAKEHEDDLLELMWDWPGRVNKSRNGYIDYSDPEVKETHRAAMLKRTQSPEWQAAMLKRTQNPVWKEIVRAANQKLSQNPVWKENVRAANQKKAQDPEWRAAMQKWAKPFIATNIITGEEYFCESSICSQAKALNLHQGSVSACLNGKQKKHKGFTFRPL